MIDDTSSVRIVLPIGEIAFPRAVADVFEPDTLTVTRIEDGLVIRIYQPGSWLSADVVGGGLDYAFACTPTTRARIIATREERLAELVRMEQEHRAGREVRELIATHTSGDPRR